MAQEWNNGAALGQAWLNMPAASRGQEEFFLAAECRCCVRVCFMMFSDDSYLLGAADAIARCCFMCSPWLAE